MGNQDNWRKAGVQRRSRHEVQLKDGHTDRDGFCALCKKPAILVVAEKKWYHVLVGKRFKGWPSTRDTVKA
jgi:hypothetical protein